MARVWRSARSRVQSTCTTRASGATGTRASSSSLTSPSRRQSSLARTSRHYIAVAPRCGAYFRSAVVGAAASDPLAFAPIDPCNRRNRARFVRQVIVKRLSTGTRIVLKSHFGYPPLCRSDGRAVNRSQLERPRHVARSEARPSQVRNYQDQYLPRPLPDCTYSWYALARARRCGRTLPQPGWLRAHALCFGSGSEASECLRACAFAVRCADTLLMGDLESCKLSEVPWSGSGQVGFPAARSAQSHTAARSAAHPLLRSWGRKDRADRGAAAL
jgi:hypothetical protein